MTDRSLVSYLIKPRAPVWSAGQLLLIAYIVVDLVGETTGGVTLGVALVACYVFELGFYQARYMLNDLFDIQVDQMHVAAKLRGRLPAVAGARRWALRGLAVRIVLSTAIVALLPYRARTVTVVAVLVLIGLTVAYESMRTLIRRSTDPDRLPFPEMAVLGLVGTGSGLRFGFGAALAGADGKLVAAGAAFGWGYGAMTQIMGWTLEAAGLRHRGVAAVLARKSHIGLLARLVGDDPVRLHHPLLAGAPARLAALLLATASALAVVAGSGLCGWPAPERLVMLLAVCAVAGPLLIAGWPSKWAGPAVMAVDVVAVAVLASGGSRLGIGALLLLTSGAATLLRSSTPGRRAQLSPSAGTPGR